MDKLRPTFQNVQHEFTAHLRDPDKYPAPQEIEDRRMQIYRGLLYRNVQGFLASGFPVTRKLFSDDHWHKMVRDFFANHHSQSPYFKDISKEFIIYLNEERVSQPEDPPFLRELTHYEWLEINISFLDADIDWSKVNKQGNLLKEVPVLSPFVKLNRYEFPVHKIKPDFQPQTPGEQPTYILIYRDLSDNVGFIEVNPITAKLVELISTNSTQTSEQLLKGIAKETPSLPEDAVIHGGHITLNDLHKKDIVLGTLNNSEKIS